VKSVSGNEQTNLVLGWHGGAADPLSIANSNFWLNIESDKKTDGGYFGNGVYFTQFLSYSDKYMKMKEKDGKIKKGTPFILSWVIMGMRIDLLLNHSFFRKCVSSD
jgi:hypothetical protein